jgi:hypothetical protein
MWIGLKLLLRPSDYKRFDASLTRSSWRFLARPLWTVRAEGVFLILAGFFLFAHSLLNLRRGSQDKYAHAACVWQQLGNDSGVILRSARSSFSDSTSRLSQNEGADHKVLGENIKLAKELGAREDDLAPLLGQLLFEPLEKVAVLQDRGLITGVRIQEPDEPESDSSSTYDSKPRRSIKLPE